MKKRLDAFEMKGLRKILRVLWTVFVDSRRLYAAVEDSFIFVDVGLWTFSPRVPM